ncbi:MAG: PAS domain-containing protein [Proteobacteria bacterium]|nr:PAS domain-containing protein [Pseudomonadota bacterium]
MAAMLGNLPQSLDPELQALADYWVGLREQLGRIPRLREVELMALYTIARNIFIADREKDIDGRILYRWRFWGTGVRNHTGIEATGRYLHETHAEIAAKEAEQSYARVLETLEPDYWEAMTRTVPVDKTFLQYRRIMLPLLDEESRPMHLIGVFAADKRNIPVAQSGLPLPMGMIENKPDPD